jgi:general stress protein CsbA
MNKFFIKLRLPVVILFAISTIAGWIIPLIFAILSHQTYWNWIKEDFIITISVTLSGILCIIWFFNLKEEEDETNIS